MKTDHVDLERFEQHQANVARAYNEADVATRKSMDATLLHLKAKRVSSVGGLRGLFPALTSKLQITKEAMKNEH